jgi:hypothetical protein
MRQCLACGAGYPDEVVGKWGQHEQSSGLGSRAVCGALVPDPAVRISAGDPVPNQVCRGELQFVAALPVGKLPVALTLLKAEKRGVA